MAKTNTQTNGSEMQEMMCVEKAMTKPVIVVNQTATIADTAKMMLDNRISGLPVVGPGGILVGIVSEGDFLRRSERGTQKKRSRWLEFFVGPGKLAQEYVQAHSRKVEEVMSGEPVSIGPANTLAQAVDLMMRHKIKRLPVVEGEKIIGILSRSDLMRAMWRSLPALDSRVLGDEHIRQDILAGLSSQSWSKNGFVRVKVDHGVAELSGTIFDERQRQAIMVATAKVHGIVSVVDQIVWVDALSGAMLGPP